MDNAKISTSQGTQPTRATHGKSTAAQGAEAQGAAGAGDFLALLTALGDGLQDASETLVPMGLPTEAELPVASDDVVAPGADPTLIAAWQGLLMAGMPQSATPSGEAGDGLSMVNVTGQGNVIADAWAAGGPADGLVAETTLLDTAVDAQEGLSPLPASGQGRMSARLQSTAGGRLDSALNARSILQGSDTVSLQQGRDALSAGQMVLDRLGGSVPVAFAERGAAGASLHTPRTDVAGVEEGGAGLIEPAIFSDARAGGQRAGDGHAPEPGAWLDGAAGEISLETEVGEVGSALADQSQAGTEEQLAERVSYWVHQKTQNAELTLQRDGRPVEVSVTLSGNEAHVSFRSDEAQTREMLDQSMAQLRDLLRSEGLELSGMSVGTSADRGAAGGQQDSQRSRDGARQAQVVSSVPAGAAPLQRAGVATDRSVDIFV